jgi:hypothetical protein
MSKFSKTKRFGLLQFRLIAIACATFTAPALGQRTAERDDLDPIAAQSSASDDEKALLKAIEQQRAIAEKQRAEAEEQFRRAMSELERTRRRGSAEAQSEMAKVREQLELAHAQLAELAAKQQQARQVPADPLPEDTILRVYQLQHAKPQKIAEVLGPIFRNNAPRIAVDERANTLVVAGSERQLAMVEELARTLDREIPEIKQETNRETLQVRIVWLLDIEEGVEPTDKLVSPQVVEALGELGFQHPKVVCQQVTTLTFDSRAGRNAGQFNFDVPVLIESQPWDLNGNGTIESLDDGRLNLRFDLHFRQVFREADGDRELGHEARLGGAIYTPLAHYTVLGTTTFVAHDPIVGGESQAKPRQHLSAFVVYLDRAREFPASAEQAENRDVAPR